MLTAANGGKIAHEVLVKDESEKQRAKERKKTSAMFFVIWIFSHRRRCRCLLQVLNFCLYNKIDTF